MELWINPSCSKCQVATELLDGAGAQYTIRRYLDDPPTVDELDAVLRRLGLDPWDIARMNEPLAEELDLVLLTRRSPDQLSSDDPARDLGRRC